MKIIKSFLGVAFLSIFLSGCIGPWAAKPVDEAERMMGTEETQIEDTSMMYDGEAPVAENLKEFVVNASNYTYDMSELMVNAGDTVRIVFVNNEGTHDFKLDEYGVATKVLNEGESETIEFVAGNPGSYEYYCSVGNHREMGMKGMLTVQ